MLLAKLYTEPKTFEPVVFRPGINFIFGKKEKVENKKITSKSKNPLNNIGKSTFLDLLDFALLANYGSSNKRLFAAYNKGYLKNKTVVLEFKIDSDEYTLKRSFESPSKDILFSKNNSNFSNWSEMVTLSECTRR